MNRPWYMGLLYGVDFETTGTDTRTDRIVQACFAKTIPGQAPIVIAEFVNPDVPIPAGATEVHGITDAYVQRYGNQPAYTIETIADEVACALNARIPVVGQNLSFDLAMLHWECVRHGVPTVLERTGGVMLPIIDLLVLDKRADPYRKGKGMRKLTALAGIYGVPLEAENAHDAVVDTLATVEVLRALGARYPELGDMPTTLLHACQVEWRAEQQTGLQAYFRGKGGKPDAYCDPCWPICLDLTHPTQEEK